jgi:excinuclease ABC subunit C
MTGNEHLQAILDSLPNKPGCYLMKDESNEIIYIGKAINLRSRVRSYFQVTSDTEIKTRRLVPKIADIQWIITGSELEALILEMTLIKKHHPVFNIRLKDDKRYPYIKVHWAEAYPKVTVTRLMQRDGARYFGPYTSSWAVHQALDVVRRLFPYLTCDRNITGLDTKACIYYDIKLCSAPCIGCIDQKSYRQSIEDLCGFLNGQTRATLDRLNLEMEKAAEEWNYELAKKRRDQMRAIQQVVEKQKVVSAEDTNSDIIAMARSNGEACVQIFFIRAGKLIGREYFILEGAEGEADAEIISEFIKQFYAEATYIPEEVLLPNDIAEAKIIREWLHTQRGGSKTELSVPRQGNPAELMQMATENAVETLRSLRTQWEADTNRQTEALAELQKALNLPTPPNRIECYDISNTQGTASVGSMVVFEQGVPNKKHYRRFNIRGVSGPDDFASMEEVLKRRFKHWQAAQDESTMGSKPDASFTRLPDLLIVDGGKGQLSRAVKVLEEFNLLGRVPAAGLAKQQEELFIPGDTIPLLLPRHSQGLYLLQRIRDEAHRFAITAHRGKRSAAFIASRMDAIPGIGPARRKILIRRFGSVERIQQASVDELADVPGITRELAEKILENLE